MAAELSSAFRELPPHGPKLGTAAGISTRSAFTRRPLPRIISTGDVLRINNEQVYKNLPWHKVTKFTCREVVGVRKNAGALRGILMNAVKWRHCEWRAPKKRPPLSRGVFEPRWIPALWSHRLDPASDSARYAPVTSGRARRVVGSAGMVALTVVGLTHRRSRTQLQWPGWGRKAVIRHPTF